MEGPYIFSFDYFSDFCSRLTLPLWEGLKIRQDF